MLSDMEKIIEIPEGYEARIDGNKIILEPKESEDERIRKELFDIFKTKNFFLALSLGRKIRPFSSSFLP